MFSIIFSNILLQLLYFIGILFVVGFLIRVLNKLFYRMLNYKKYVVYGTGIIGTPFHELSHALMCLVFGHKILEIKFFQIDEESGTLGYVSHTYNHKNIYQVIGSFFIGTAPIFVGTIFICVLIKAMIPAAAVEIEAYLQDFALAQSMGISVYSLKYAAITFSGMVGAILSCIDLGAIWWGFAVIALCIAIHMNLSQADISHSVKALPYLIGAFVVFNLLFGVIAFSTYETAVYYINLAGGYFVGILLLALMLSIACVAIATAIKYGKSGIVAAVKLVAKRFKPI
ncbi:MAG: hypothetical protein E7637_02875 [Ruminococcaceae bacterium]|nr:hypothetical protein [Oscillospiraceae bacterium]